MTVSFASLVTENVAQNDPVNLRMRCFLFKTRRKTRDAPPVFRHKPVYISFLNNELLKI